MTRILFATTNPHKLERFRSYYQDLGLTVLGLKDLDIDNQAIEDGRNPTENAVNKALVHYHHAKIPTFAVDYGLYIQKFPPDKQPGLFVRRIFGDQQEASDQEMLDYYIHELEKIGGQSPAKWVSAIALAMNDNTTQTEEFSRQTILTAQKSPNTTPGEPLNSIQIDPNTGKYFTDLSTQEWLKLQQQREQGYINFMKKHLSTIKDGG